MATHSIPDDIAQMSAEGLHRYAHGLLQEMGGDNNKVFAVAAAGATYVGEKDINARSLFDVIQGISEDVSVPASLSAVIDQLAKLAGSSMAPEEARKTA